MTPGFQKYWSLSDETLKATCSLRNSKRKKNCSDWIVSFEHQLLLNCFFGGNLGKVEILEFDTSSN
jgi:hypothetical protein